MSTNTQLPSSFAWISIAAAITTILLKFSAYVITGSIGFFSDAIESFVNLVTATTSLIALRIAERPADAQHAYGHTKAEYFASVVEGVSILIASGGIALAAFSRLAHPQPIHGPFLGIVISVLASSVNALVAIVLFRAGRKHRSIALESEAHHLMTDVWTSVAVIAGVGAVFFTNIQLLDPLIALMVSANIVFSGFRIIKNSVLGFMDTSISAEDIRGVEEVLHRHCIRDISYHGLRTRSSASRRFVTFHVLVPGHWTVRRGHNLLEKIEQDLHGKFEKMTITTHLEPREDARSSDDISLDRTQNGGD